MSWCYMNSIAIGRSGCKYTHFMLGFIYILTHYGLVTPYSEWQKMLSRYAAKIVM